VASDASCLLRLRPCTRAKSLRRTQRASIDINGVFGVEHHIGKIPHSEDSLRASPQKGVVRRARAVALAARLVYIFLSTSGGELRTEEPGGRTCHPPEHRSSVDFNNRSTTAWGMIEMTHRIIAFPFTCHYSCGGTTCAPGVSRLSPKTLVASNSIPRGCSVHGQVAVSSYFGST
jgi:hypothetical protein